MSQSAKTTASVGFLIGISSWSLSFITLIWAYGVYRLRAGAWYAHVLSMEEAVLAVVNTIAIIASSLLLRAWVKGNYLRKVLFLASLGLGLLFMAGQWYLWQGLIKEGFTHRSSVAGSFFYLLTGFHALHIVVGLFLLFFLSRPLLAGSIEEVDQRRFNNGLCFWDLLTVFWIVLFILIFAIQ